MDFLGLGSDNYLNPENALKIMPHFINSKTIGLNKELNDLDLFVLEFTKILEKYTPYAVVSGYVALLFGRSRATEDVDIIIPKIDREKFLKLFEDLEKEGYWCLNADDTHSLFDDYLTQKVAVRFAKKNNVIPNIELKFAKNDFDLMTIKERIKVQTLKGAIYISRLEEEIAYKETVLGSEKDLEDARFLRKVFEKNLNPMKIEEIKKTLK